MIIQTPAMVQFENTSNEYSVAFIPFKQNFNVVIQPGDTLKFEVEHAEEVLYYFGQATNILNVTSDVIDTGNSFLTFKLANQVGDEIIDNINNKVSVTMPNGSSITNIAPTFTVSKDATVKVNGVEQKSGKTKHDFTSPIVYNVISEDAAVRAYTVTVLVQMPTPAAPTISGSTLSITPVEGATSYKVYATNVSTGVEYDLGEVQA